MLKKSSLCLTRCVMGHTGYSAKENVNNIKIKHLHWELQLIFDESQVSGEVQMLVKEDALERECLVLRQ